MTEHRDRGRVGNVIFRPERAAEERANAERVEERSRDAREPHARRLASALQHCTPVVGSHDRRAREHRAVRGPLAKMPVGQLDDRLATLVGLPDDRDTLGTFHGQRPQQHAVHGAEDRAVGTDGQANVITAVTVNPGDWRR
jgi:hypothetical protein